MSAISQSNLGTKFIAGKLEIVKTDKIEDIVLFDGEDLELSSVRKKGALYICEVQYKSDDYIAGLQLKYKSRGLKILNIIYKWGDRLCEASEKDFITQWSSNSNSIISYTNPDNTWGLNSPSRYFEKDTLKVGFFILFEKLSEDMSFNIESNFKCVKNMYPATANLLALTSPPDFSKWSPEEAFGNNNPADISHVKRTAAMALSGLYKESLDINEDHGALDILDVVALCNYRYYSLQTPSNVSAEISSKEYTPQYIGLESSNLTRTELLDAEFVIQNVDIQHSNNNQYFSLGIDVAFKAPIDCHGWQFDIGRSWETYSFADKEDNSYIKPNVIFKGQLDSLKDFYDYRAISVNNRYGYDNITRVAVYRKPFNGEDPTALVDLSRQNILLNSHGVETRNEKEILIRLEWNNIQKLSNISMTPQKEYYLKKDFDVNSENIEQNIHASNKGQRWYGDVNYDETTLRWYTEKYYNPISSIELDVKWDLFGILNRKAITNSNLSRIKHYSRGDQGLENFSYQFVYPEEGPTSGLGVLEQFGNDYQMYAESVLGYINNTLRNGIDSGVSSRYDDEPIVPADYIAGYMNDHDLSGTKNIVDTTALSNMFTVRISTSGDGGTGEQTTADAIANIIKNKTTRDEVLANPGSQEKKILDSLNTVVPTLIINENSTHTLPEIEPGLPESGVDGSMLFFTNALECKDSTLPREFRSWKQYFSDMYDIEHHNLPENDDFLFFQINLSTNSDKAKFFTGTHFILDLENAISSGDGDMKLNKLGEEIIDEEDSTTNFISVLPGKCFEKNKVTTTAILKDSNGGLATSGAFEELHLSLLNNNDYHPAVTINGGSLNVASFFVFGPANARKSIEDIKISFGSSVVSTDTADGEVERSVKWKDVPMKEASEAYYTETISNDLLYFGPDLNYKTFFSKSNSASKQVYDDVVIHTKVNNRREISLYTQTAFPYKTLSLDLLLSEWGEVSIKELSSSFDTSSSVKYDSGIQKWNLQFTSLTDINGYSQIAKIKFSEDVFEEYIQDSDPDVEMIYPPIGMDKTLVAANISEDYIYPTWDKCKVYFDSSDPHYVKQSTTSTEVLEVSNLFGHKHFEREAATNSHPNLDKSLNFGNDRTSLAFEHNTTALLEDEFVFDPAEELQLYTNIVIEYKDLKEIFETDRDINTSSVAPLDGVNLLTWKMNSKALYDSGDTDPFNGTWIFLKYGKEKEPCVYWDNLKDLISDMNGTASSEPLFIEHLAVSGSFYAIKEGVTWNGVDEWSVVNQVDIENGHVIDEDTKYVLNAYGPWGTTDDDGTAVRGFYTEAEMATSVSPTGFPDWWFTVSKEGKLSIHRNSNASGQWFVANPYALVAGGAAGGAGASADHVVHMFTSIWNSRKTEHIRLRNDDGEFVYLSSADGEIFADQRREMFDVLVYTYYDINGNNDTRTEDRLSLPLPSPYEVLNSHYKESSFQALRDASYLVNLNTTDNRTKLDVNINGEKYGTLDFSTSTDFQFDDTTLTDYFLWSKFGESIDNYTIEYPATYVTTTDETYNWDNLNFSIGEMAFFNKTLTDDERHLLTATIMNKWGFEKNLYSGNPFYEEEPNVIKASFSNPKTHPDKLSLDKIKNYNKNRHFKNGSTRYSSAIVADKIQVTNAVIRRQANLTASMSDFNNRELPAGFELSDSSSSKIFISQYNSETGMAEISYRSDRKIDAFQLELGNFRDNPEQYIYDDDASGVGIIDTFSSELLNDFQWGTPVIGKGPGQYPHEKVNKIIYAVSPFKNLDLEGPYPSREYGSWPLPPTGKGESNILCTIKVDPTAFNGQPIIEDFVLASNDKEDLTALPSGYSGMLPGLTKISISGSLQDVEERVKAGYYVTSSSDTTIANEAGYFDSNGNGRIDITDYLTIRNHISENATDISGSAVVASAVVVPSTITSSITELPDYTLTASISQNATSALSASLEWTQAANGDGADSFQIWRRDSNINNQYTPSGEWKRLTTTRELTYIDRDPPYNKLAESMDDNPQFEYLLVATNEHGSSTLRSGVPPFQFDAWFSGNLTVQDITITTNKGVETVIMPSYYDTNSAAPPHGANSTNPDSFEFSFSPPDKAAGKFIKDRDQIIFHFDNDYRNFVGKISGKYTVRNSNTGDSLQRNYTINVLPQPFDLSIESIKEIDSYRNVISFDLNSVGSVDYVILQRTDNLAGTVSWSSVGEQIHTEDLEYTTIKIEDVITASGTYDLSNSNTFYYRVLAYEDNNKNGISDTGDFEVTSNILTQSCAARHTLNTIELTAGTHVEGVEDAKVIFTIPVVQDSSNVDAKSFAIYSVDDSSDTLVTTVHQNLNAVTPITASVQSEAGIASESYERYFKVIGLSEDLMTTTSNILTASLDKYALTPAIESITFDVCLDDGITGDLKNYVSNYSGLIGDITFSEQAGSTTGLTISSDGTFTYNPSTIPAAPDHIAYYNATAQGQSSSGNASITFNVVAKCDKCPEDDIICRYEKINSEHQSDYSGHTPYRFTERGVSTIRKRDENAGTEYKVTINK